MNTFDHMITDNLKTKYDEQRKERLADCINDYLDDSEVNSEKFVNELIEVLKNDVKYYENCKQKRVQTLSTLNKNS
jgi:hypothetical protein